MEERYRERFLLTKLTKVNVLWKEDGGKTYITSKTGTYILNAKSSLIWKFIGKEDLEKITEIYSLKFGNKNRVSNFIKELKRLGLVEDLGNESTTH